MAANIGHIRVGVIRAGKRINDSRGNPGRTLCGAPLTQWDATIRDRIVENGAWTCCEDCKRIKAERKGW